MKGRLKRLYFKIPIKVKWSVFICILVSYPIFFIGYVGYTQYEEVITNHFVEAVEKEVFSTLEVTKENTKRLEEFVKELKYDEAIHLFNQRYYAVAIDQKAGTPIIGDYELGRMVEGYLKSVVLSKPEIDISGYQFRDQKTEYIVSKKKSYTQENDFRKKKIFEHLKLSLEKTKKTLAYYIDEESNIYIGETIFDRNKFEEVGIIVFKIKKDYLLGHYGKLLGGAKEGIYVIEKEKKEMLVKGKVPENKSEKVSGFLVLEPEEGKLYKSEGKQDVILYAKVSSLNLSVVSTLFISKDVLLQDIRHLSSITIILCMSTLPIFLLFAAGLYKEIIDPIYTLSSKMQLIEKGDMGVVMKSDRQDELGYLFGTFDRMSKRIKYLVNTVYKEEIALKNAEIKLLQDQINPHFLYNTLEMINWKARMCGNNEISEMIEALSGIMEVNIDRRKIPFLTIEEEIKYLDHYLFLIHKRFGEKIIFKRDVDIRAYALKIPRIMLQPLIENAIKHGIEPVGGGTVYLGIKIEDHKLIMTIQDDGQGIEEDVLAKMQKAMNSEEKIVGKVGVINVQKRIKLLYGEGYGLTVTSKPDEGTLIMVILPVTTTGESL